jgi:Spy/CpxP family protein refolding chaperone
MKKQFWNLSVAALLMCMLITEPVFAQPGRKAGPQQRLRIQNRFMDIPALTEEQKTKITELNTAHFSKMKSTRDQLRIKHAELLNLIKKDAPDQAAIDKKTDEIVELNKTAMLERTALFISVRAILDEGQKAYFDNHCMYRQRPPRLQGKPGLSRNNGSNYAG